VLKIYFIETGGGGKRLRYSGRVYATGITSRFNTRLLPVSNVV